ncbi:MAG: carboxyl transferase domain-containing protein [Pseudomonadota bacterium]
MADQSDTKTPLERMRERYDAGSENHRSAAIDKRHRKGWRTARENLADLVDADSFSEYGALALAAQRGRRDADELIANTTGDGVITGIGTVNAEQFGAAASRTALVINDYTVLAATQGFYHHRKIDRLLEIAARDRLPVVMYAEGGGGRPGDTDVATQVSGLDVPTFARWARVGSRAPRIAVANGYCFAGNGLLFGCADFRIATRTAWIGMAGPAMIEAGGLGSFDATEIGPAETHFNQGTIDLLADNEAEATRLTKQLLGYLQGASAEGQAHEQSSLREVLPADRRFTYRVRPAITTIGDKDSFLELGAGFGSAMITGFMRMAGKPVGVLANDNQSNAGAIDADAAAKAARFLKLCDARHLPVLSFIDTPGFMVGPDSEAQAAVRHMTDMFTASAVFGPPMIAIVLRKAYGLGAMAMARGGFNEPEFCAAWPNGEFGAMGLEGAVKLGFRKELESIEDADERQRQFESLVQQLYERGSALEVASMLEIDAVIDPADTRAEILRMVR